MRVSVGILASYRTKRPEHAHQATRSCQDIHRSQFQSKLASKIGFKKIQSAG